MDPRQLLRSLFDTAVAAADPAVVLPAHLPPPPQGRTVVVGAGKASAAMGLALERHWPGELSGLIVTRYGHGAPVPAARGGRGRAPGAGRGGRAAAERILELVQGLTAGRSGARADLGWRLVAADPAARGADAGRQAGDQPGAAALRRLDRRDELRAQASVARSRAAGSPPPRSRRRIVSLLISDVPGDDPAIIASGPTVADPTTAADAVAILARYRIELPPNVRRHLDGPLAETPKPGDPRLAHAEVRLIAAPQLSLEAAAAAARAAGVTPLLLGDALEGEAREVGKVMAGIARSVRRHGQPLAAPAVLLSGGETTVTVRGDGRGGRNVEYRAGPGRGPGRARRHLGARRRHGRHRRGRGGGRGHRHPRHARPRPRRRPEPAHGAGRTTTPTACSTRSATRWSPARPSPTSTISAPSWSCQPQPKCALK